MGGREFFEVVTVGNHNVYSVASDPNGSLEAPIGSLAMAESGLLYQNRDGGTIWDLVPPIISQSSATGFTIPANVSRVNADNTGPETYLLPQIGTVPVGWRVTLTKLNTGGDVATLDGNGAQINGAASVAISAQYESVTVEKVRTSGFISFISWTIVARTP